MDEAERIAKAFHALKPVHPKARIEVSGGLNRPPMVRDATMKATFRQARKIAAKLGIQLKQGSTGGASDGNFTAGMGIPTLDGMGPVGEGAHARHENVVVDSIAERAALLASIWMEWE
jgi:glutamate carboxypeptidase